jgi:hypothetical protein
VTREEADEYLLFFVSDANLRCAPRQARWCHAHALDSATFAQTLRHRAARSA